MALNNFLNVTPDAADEINDFLISEILMSREKLNFFLCGSISDVNQKNFYEKFIDCLVLFSKYNQEILRCYFSGDIGINKICHIFIEFCYDQKPCLSRGDVIRAFQFHNQLSDEAVKEVLNKLFSKKNKEVSILGFGLGDGEYEKSLAEFCLRKKLAKSVRIYGFDPYASVSKDIELLNQGHLDSSSTPVFDIVIARWALHHVAHKDRWDNFIKCINCCSDKSFVLIIEHGFFRKEEPEYFKKLYYFLNASFDVFSNIFINPDWFMSTYPEVGENFYIDYLTQQDFSIIKKNITRKFTEIFKDIGPGFPNQTFYALLLS